MTDRGSQSQGTATAREREGSPPRAGEPAVVAAGRGADAELAPPAGPPSPRNFTASTLVHGWSLVAGCCLIAAGVFWWRAQPDAAFVAAALGIVAWFLNVRRQFRPLTREDAGDGIEDFGEDELDRDEVDGRGRDEA